MKVLGQLMNHFEDCGLDADRRGYAVLDVQQAFVSTERQHFSSEEWDDCFVAVTSGLHHFEIKFKNELELRDDGHCCQQKPALLTEEMANRLIRDIAAKELVDLDEYGLGLYYHNKSAVAVENKIDSLLGEYDPLTIAFAVNPLYDNDHDSDEE